jgi:DNA mismatch endonuclease (patch repair protein)
MSRVRGKNTKPEIALRRALHAHGLRFRLHAALPGRPDIVFVSARIAVFVDGAFWHGRDLERLPEQLHVRRKFWLDKIRANVERDRRNDADLGRIGFHVMRFWADEVVRAPDACAKRVLRIYQRRMAGNKPSTPKSVGA